MSGVFLQLLAVLPDLPGEVLGHVDVGALEEGRLAEDFLTVLPAYKVDEDRTAASNLKPRYNVSNKR